MAHCVIASGRPGRPLNSVVRSHQMRHRYTRPLLITGIVLGLLAALYCFGGILAAGSLFTGERAQSNFAFWGTALLVSLIVAVGCGIALGRDVGAAKRQTNGGRGAI